MLREFLSAVASPLESEYFQVVNTQVTVEQLVLTPHVILQLLERLEDALLAFAAADDAAMLEELQICLLYSRSVEHDASFAVYEVAATELLR